MITIKPLQAISGSILLIAAACATSEAMTLQMPPPAAPPTAEFSDTALAEMVPDLGAFPASLSVCPRMKVANRPATDAELAVMDYAPFVVVQEKVTLAAAPVEAGCISSGFGPRNAGQHKGVDFYNRDPVDIYAAGYGTVKEMTYRDDFGNVLVIDHGDGVFTRYAHLQEFGADLEPGASVKAGEIIGVMGNTAAYPVARHLHYEILTGEWGPRKGSFALTPVDVLTLPAAEAGS